LWTMVKKNSEKWGRKKERGWYSVGTTNLARPNTRGRSRITDVCRKERETRQDVRKEGRERVSWRHGAKKRRGRVAKGLG